MRSHVGIKSMSCCGTKRLRHTLPQILANFLGVLNLLMVGSSAWLPSRSTSCGIQRIPSQIQLSMVPQNHSVASLLPPPETEGLKRTPRRKSFKASNDNKGVANATRRDNRRWTKGDGSKQSSSLPSTIPQLSDLLLQRVTPFSNSSQTQANNASERRPRHHRVDGKRDDDGKKPWMADYYTSCKTQQRIKDAATTAAASIGLVDRPAIVLSTFLNTPPERCNAANLVCALTSSAKLLPHSSTLSDNALSLFYRTTNLLGQMLELQLLSARQLCNVAWAVAKFYSSDDRVLPPPQARAALSSDNVLGSAETWDLTLVRADDPAQKVDQLVDEVAMQIVNLLHKDPLVAKEGELCMVSWALGVLRPRDRPPGWKHGPQVASIQRRRQQQQSQEAINVIKFESWTTSDIENDDPTDLVVESSSPADILFDAVARALVTSGRASPDQQQTNRIYACQWKELANLAWAFASHGRSSSSESQELLLKIADETAGRLAQGGNTTKRVLSRDLSQIIWSLGVLQADNFRLADGLDTVVDAVVDMTGVRTKDVQHPFRTWSCADIVQVVLSLAHARIDEPSLLGHLFEEAARRMESGAGLEAGNEVSRMTFQTWEVSILLWTQARLHLKQSQGQIFERFARIAATHLIGRINEDYPLSTAGIGAQEQANIVWSLTVLEECKDPNSIQLIRRIFKEAANTCQLDGIIHLEHAHQLWQALFLLEAECPQAVGQVPRWFYVYLRDKWRAEKSRTKVSSARHRALSQTLTSMGVMHVNEHDEDIDVAIVLKPKAAWSHETLVAQLGGSPNGRTSDGVRLAVEFDGPNHFTRQRPTMKNSPSKADPPRALGHTVLKYRLLKKQGWIVVRVPYYEFDRIPFWASMERQRYLQRLLKTHGRIQFSGVDVSEYRPQVPNKRSRFE